MLVKSEEGFCFLSKFANFGQLVHGFSTKDFGDLKKEENFFTNIKKFATAVKIDPENIVRFEQIHQDRLTVVSKKHQGGILKGFDGGVTAEKNLFLAVTTADCIPLLVFDSVNNIVGIIHLGWRGIVANFGLKLIAKLQSVYTSQPEDIICGIGPSIGPCCYEVRDDVASLFAKIFQRDQQIIQTRDKKIFLDLRSAVFRQLINLGIPAKNIDSPAVCVSCQNDIFYSTRAEKQNLPGENLAVIGMKTR